MSALGLAASVLGILVLLALLAWVWTQLGAFTAARREPPSGRLVECAGRTIHVVERGDGPSVALVHGTDGLLEDFTESLVDRLAESHRCLAFDRPGHGWSAPLPGPFRGVAGDARALSDAAAVLGAPRPIVVGHSYGGAVALRWALDAPESVAGLVLISPATHPDPIFDQPLHRLARHPIAGAPIRHVLLRPLGTVSIARILRAAFTPAEPPPRYVERMRALALRPAQFAAHARELASLNESLEEQVASYRTLRVPIAIVAAEDDRLTAPHRHARRLAADVPGARLTVLPRGGHELHHLHPEAVVEALEWASRQGRGPDHSEAESVRSSD